MKISVDFWSPPPGWDTVVSTSTKSESVTQLLVAQTPNLYRRSMLPSRGLDTSNSKGSDVMRLGQLRKVLVEMELLPKATSVTFGTLALGEEGEPIDEVSLFHEDWESVLPGIPIEMVIAPPGDPQCLLVVSEFRSRAYGTAVNVYEDHWYVGGRTVIVDLPYELTQRWLDLWQTKYWQFQRQFAESARKNWRSR